jgi:putative restriction endonuclease
MQKDLVFYGQRFAKLRVNRSGGVAAPHKPILLLAVMELIGRGTIADNRIELSPELIATFLKYWSALVVTKHQSNIALPFFHLKGDGFWFLAPNLSYEGNVAHLHPSLTALRNAVRWACLDGELFEILLGEAGRLHLTQVLLRVWFPHVEVAIDRIYAVDEFGEIQRRLVKDGGAVYGVEDLKDEDRLFVRNSAFRRVIISNYQYRCAFCLLKVISESNQNIVDGAHIMPFAEFRDDRFDNGLALCKNHHWAFDRGWFGIGDDFRILVPTGRVHEEGGVGVRFSARGFANDGGL